MFFLVATVQQDAGWDVPAGAALGLLCAAGVGYGLYRGGVRLNLRRFFLWTGAFIVFVAAGLLAGALRAFHEAGVWNSLQETAFDFGGVLPDDSVVGTLLTGILGYHEAPSVGEVTVYLAFLVPVLALFLTQSRPRPAVPSPA